MDILDRKARLTLAEKAGLKSQEGFENVVDEAATLRAHKVIEHGEDRYAPGQELLNLVETMTMIRKKGLRTNRMLERIVKEGADVIAQDSMDSLRDTLLDGMNYNGMGVQLLDQMFPPSLVGSDTRLIQNTRPFLPIEQIAIQVEGTFRAQKMLYYLGLTEWSEDIVTAIGFVHGKKGENRAHLLFNYQAGPFELELIHYEEGPNWLADLGQTEGLSHFGIHVQNMGTAMEALRLRMPHIKIAQEVQTRTHTNLKIPPIRRYWYVILDTRGTFGFDLKLIQRLTVDNYNDYPIMISEREA